MFYYLCLNSDVDTIIFFKRKKKVQRNYLAYFHMLEAWNTVCTNSKIHVFLHTILPPPGKHFKVF